ncbi:hypothetical protein TrCOL_g13824 [Triparma columacea]|uniref:Uncharacterized protein n=1 Tax=Triparma columacea TaxID=722753 RepID=A0A9W7G6V2_9STRA|nr:hypothetical protein TrCOL_g13824 [Triparma columacea]
MPKSAVYSGRERFFDDHELTEVIFAKGVTRIAEFAFYGCSSLAAITIPDSVTTIGMYAFDSCTALTRLSLSPAVSVHIESFSNCTALISAAASQNMPTVEDLLNSRWHRILERAAVLSCLKTPWNDDLESQHGSNKLKRKHLDGEEVVALQGIVARKMLPKVMWRVILEFL